LDELTSRALYAAGISRNSTDKFVFEDLNIPKKAFAVSFHLACSLLLLLIAYTDVFNLLAAVAIHGITSKHERFLSSQNDRNVRSLLIDYDHMCTKVNRINAINSHVLLIVYLRLVIWISTSSLDVMESNNWLLRALVLSYYILHAFAFILAADANKKVQFTMKTIL